MKIVFHSRARASFRHFIPTTLILLSNLFTLANAADLPITTQLKTLVNNNPDIKSYLITSLTEAYKVNPDPKTNPGAQGATGEEKLQSYYSFVNGAAMVVPNEILRNPPDLIRDQILQTICAFYFLVDQPVTALEGRGYFKPAIQYEPRFSAWLRDFAGAWGDFLDTPASWRQDTYQNFFNDPNFRLSRGDYVGWDNWQTWSTFNEFFSRYFIAGKRPIASPADPSVIVSPADSVPQGVWEIDANSNIVVDDGLPIKNLRYFNVNELLHPDSPYKGAFANGRLTHTFLNVFDYHRYHFPIAGRVLTVDKVQQNVVLEVSWDSAAKKYVPIDSTGWQFMQTRGIVVMETHVGLVALIPMGMAHVSSVNFENSVVPGAQIQKGDMLGTFLFGGSDYIVLFQEDADFELTVPPSSGVISDFANANYQHVLVRSKYGRVAPHNYLAIASADRAKVLDVPGWSLREGEKLIFWGSNGQQNQRWRFEYSDGGYGIIKSEFNGLCVDVEYGSASSGANIIQWGCHYRDNQLWKRERTDDGYYNLRSKLSGLCLNIVGGSPQRLEQRHCDGSQSQKFHISF